MLMLRMIGARLLIRIVPHRKALGILVLFAIALLALTLKSEPTMSAGTAVLPPDTTRIVVPTPASVRTVDSTEVIWLARAIYSETKLPHEQELVAWVIRNRVETGYRGKKTYQEVVLDPWQFSAFNRNSPKRRYYSSLTFESTPAGFQRAIEIAHRVTNEPARSRPFAQNTRHFYSERSMRGRRAPHWAVNKKPVHLDRKVDPRRFRFYAGIS